MKTMTLSRRDLVAGMSAGVVLAGAQPIMAAATDLQPYKLVMLGDSITEGYGLQPSQSIPSRLQALLSAEHIPVRIVNAGVSGETSSDVLRRFDRSIPKDANGVLIAVGANDLLQLLPPQDLAANLRAMLDRLRARNISGAMAGMQVPSFIRAPYQEAFDAVYPAVARQYKVPLYPYILDGVALIADYNQDDGIHPNAAGAKVIAQRLAPFTVEAFGLHS